MTFPTHIFRDPPLNPDAPCDCWRTCTADEAEALRGQGFEIKRLSMPMRSYGWCRVSVSRKRRLGQQAKKLSKKARAKRSKQKAPT